MIEIYTDSCSDLSPELKERFGIHVVPLSVFIDGTTYQDGVDVSTSELFKLVKKTSQLPKTSAPTIADFVNAFNESQGDILFISISAQLSVTLQNAITAAGLLPERKIMTIDSHNLSTGIGLLVLKAAELRDAGLPIEEIHRQVSQLVPRVHTSFVIDTLDYMYKGGRCSALQHVITSLLRIRPIIEVHQDGTLGVKEKVGGARKKALNSMLEDFKNNLPNIDLHRVFVTHTGCHEDALYLQEELQKLAPVEEICETVAGATVATHCGPDTIGILFFAK
jgi:DegV family protein with EDD domain